MIVTPASFVFGYVIHRWGVGKLAKGKDQNILLITLGLSIIMENTALFFFTGDQQTVSLSYSYEAFDLGFMFLSYPKLISFFAALLICALLWVLMTFTDLGKAIRAVAKERQGARLVGIDVEHIFAVTFGIGIACLGAAGVCCCRYSMLIPIPGIFLSSLPSPLLRWAAWAASSVRSWGALSSALLNPWAASSSGKAWARSASR